MLDCSILESLIVWRDYRIQRIYNVIVILLIESGYNRQCIMSDVEYCWSYVTLMYVYAISNPIANTTNDVSLKAINIFGRKCIDHND